MAGALPHSLSLIMSHNPSVLGAQVRVQPAGNPGCSWCRFPTLEDWNSHNFSQQKMLTQLWCGGKFIFHYELKRLFSIFAVKVMVMLSLLESGQRHIRSCCWPWEGRLNCRLSVFPKHTPAAPQLDWVRQCLIEIHEFWLRGERRPIAVQSGDPIALLANTCVSLIKGPLLWFPSTQSQDLKVIYHPIGLHMSNAAVKYH